MTKRARLTTGVVLAACLLSAGSAAYRTLHDDAQKDRFVYDGSSNVALP